MKKRIAPTFAVLVVLSLLAAGCEQAKQYAGFAQLGSTYAAAVDRLLVAAGNTKIDETSETLLNAKSLAGSLSVDQYQRQSNVDRERLKIIGRLRAHVQLTAKYFALLNELATSDGPDRAKNAVQGVTDGLKKLDVNVPGQPVISALAKLVVSGVIRGALHDELNSERQATIRTELVKQQALLNYLAEQIGSDLETSNALREKRAVIDPLTARAAIADPDAWVANRRAVLNATTVPDELRNARDAVEKLNEAFDDLIKGRLTMERVNSLLTDFDSLLSVAETLKSQAGARQ